MLLCHKGHENFHLHTSILRTKSTQQQYKVAKLFQQLSTLKRRNFKRLPLTNNCTRQNMDWTDKTGAFIISQNLNVISKWTYSLSSITADTTVQKCIKKFH